MFKQLTILICFISILQFAQAQCNPVAVATTTMGCAPLSVVFNVPNVNTGTVTWHIESFIYNQFYPTHVFSLPGTYIVTLTTISDTGTCQGTATLMINVVTGPENGCSNTISGLKETLDFPEIKISPNPVKEILKISLEGSLGIYTLHYQIFDAMQKLIREGENKLNPFFISTTDLLPGIYHIRLRTDERQAIKKFVKTE